MKVELNFAEVNQFDAAIIAHYGNALEHMTENDDKFRAAVQTIPCMVQKIKHDYPMEIDCGYSPTNVNVYLKKDSRMLSHLYADAAKLAWKHMEMMIRMRVSGDGYTPFTKTSMIDFDNLNLLIHAHEFNMDYVRLRYTVITLWGVQAWNDIVGSYMYHTYQSDPTN